MNKYTKGPWGIMKGDHGPIIFSGECGRGVAMLARQVTTSERDANALLISAAPELLEALRGMVALEEENLRSGDDIDVCFELESARAAIAKAKGETK